MGTEDVKVTAMNRYKYKERLRLYKRWPCSTNPKVVGSIPTLVRVFLCPCVGPFPSVGLTLTWFIWDRNLALHITLYSDIFLSKFQVHKIDPRYKKILLTIDWDTFNN